jgi:hypothetical protein
MSAGTMGARDKIAGARDKIARVLIAVSFVAGVSLMAAAQLRVML